jgi:putative SOS response-associated peptidase YedK
MCGRIVLKAPVHQIAAAFDVTRVAPELTQLFPRFNVAPTEPVAAVRSEAGKRALVQLKWGLIPPWSPDPSVGAKMFNARSETVTEKRSFREAFARRRCLVPVDGFYEWEKKGRERLPHYFHAPDGALLALAGLWEHWEFPGGQILESCSVLTTEANRLMRRIHHRMPVILPPAAWADWLAAGPDAAQRLLPLLRPAAEGALREHPVSRQVNRAGAQGPELIEPVHDDPPGQLGLFG